MPPRSGRFLSSDDHFTLKLMLPEEFLLRRSAQSQLKEHVKTRNGGNCLYCGFSASKLSVDHIIPRSRGGSTTHYNLVPACLDCNRLKANRDVWEFWQTSEHWEGAIASGRVATLLEILEDRRSLLEYLQQSFAESPVFRLRG